MIELLHTIPTFSALDLDFAHFMSRLADGASDELLLASALLSSRVQQGHICLDLRQVAGSPLMNVDQSAVATCPELDHWVQALRHSPVVGGPGEYTPLVLDKELLYLHRYWRYESELAESILRRAAGDLSVDPEKLSSGLQHLFAGVSSKGIDWQKVAAAISLRKPFCVITGGPGTGKTTTVIKILALLTETCSDTLLRIALAAPTGKAAARLQQSIAAQRERLDVPSRLKDLLPSEVSTIHRLLGAQSGSPHFLHNARNPLHCDVLVIDEASMVDLALMSKVFAALLPGTRVILLGDKDQLASVEAGSVLGDICAEGRPDNYSPDMVRFIAGVTGAHLTPTAGTSRNSPIDDCIVSLRTIYRFADSPGIAAFSAAANEGNADTALDILCSGGHADLILRDVPDSHALGRMLDQSMPDACSPFLTAETIEEALDRLGSFRILCAVRQGPFGITAVNSRIERALVRAGLIDVSSGWYAGKPVMISVNDYSLNLFNGDTGLIMRDAGFSDALRACFKDGKSSIKKVVPQRLPPHETAYALTVHKSQGSEFDRVVLILPDANTPVLTRELIYTAVTRARKKVEIWGRKEILMSAIHEKINRRSGLRERLWGSRLEMSQ
jgi:exodeoxyribonuclease V alpha subunit